MKLENSQAVVRKNLGKLVLTVTILVSFIVGYFQVIPNVKTQIKIRDDKIQLEQKRDNIAKSLSNLRAINYQSEEARLEGVNVLIPANNDFLKMLSFIEFLAKQNGIDLTSNIAASFGQPTGKVGELAGFSIQSSFDGDYLAIKNFLQAVYQARRAIAIDSISFGGQSDDSRIAMSVNFFLPTALSAQSQKIRSLEGEVSTFAKEDEDLIRSLKNRSIVAVSTASASFGRQNPFSTP